MKERTMRKVFYLLGIAVVLLAMLAGRTRIFAATPVPPAPANMEVKIDNFTFSPATITVAAGTQVTWTNHDDIPHNVVADDTSFKSKTLDTDEKFTYTFTKPGTYSYLCTIHPKMTGKVVVQ